MLKYDPPITLWLVGNERKKRQQNILSGTPPENWEAKC